MSRVVIPIRTDRALKDIAENVTALDCLFFHQHRQSVGHREREICDQCPQPITNMIVRYGEDKWSIKPRKRRQRGIYG